MMLRHSIALLLLCSVSSLAQESATPHQMLTADGKVDMDKCGACHEEDNKTLSRSKVETCTLCHAVTQHPGSAEHLRAPAATVTRFLGTTNLPRTEEGGIYCGTCHIFHDPRVTKETALPNGWVPEHTDLPQAVRDSLVTRSTALAQKYNESGTVATFVTTGTKNLRMPIADGTLCKTCHRELP